MRVCAAAAVAQLPSILVSAPAEPLSVQSGDIDAQDGTATAAVHSADDQAAAAARAIDTPAPQQEEVIDVTHRVSSTSTSLALNCCVAYRTAAFRLCFV